MKFPNPMNAKLLLPLLLALNVGPALADDGYAVFGSGIVMVAQSTPEERRFMRERWEQASPEERLRMRRDYQDRQEQRARGKRDGNAERNGYSMGFGIGFEHRRDEREDERGNADSQAAPMPPGNFADPGEFFDRRKNHSGRRQ